MRITISFFLITCICSFFLAFSHTDDGGKKMAPRIKSGNVYYTSSYGQYPTNEILVKSKVLPNQFLSTILSDYGVSNSAIHAFNYIPDSIFNPKKIRAGQTYAILMHYADNTLSPKAFIYEKDAVNYVICYLLDDSISVVPHKKPITIVQRNVSGTIHSSLYLTLENAGVNPILAIELSEIYAWTIDFYRIQAGDYFKAIYSELYVDNQSIGVDEVQASLFNHYGKDNYAFYYEGDTTQPFGEYYDESGNSLRKAFLQAPVKYSRISSKFSYNRYHPVTNQWKAHLGTDYAAPTGTPIYATADGVISEAQYKKYNGNYVKIRHNSMYTTQYLHMSRIGEGISPGVFVQQGDVIGYVGSTGLATGPHVCYRFWKNGQQVDPYAQDLPESEPLDSLFLDDYYEHINEYKRQLDALTLN